MLASSNARIPRAWYLCYIFCFLALALSVLPQVVCAQQKTDAAPTICTQTDIAGLIVPEGRSVRVNPVREGSGPQGSNASGRNKPDPGSSSIGIALGASADRDLTKAYNIFLREARQGNPAAMVNLAVSSLAGWGTQPNSGAALYWLHTAADHNYALALYDLGILYFRGCGVRQDYSEAFRFFEEGALAGDSAAQVNLAYFYDHGIGVPQDRAAAASWYRKAAESGEPQAEYNLADLYLHGEGVPLDETTSFVWFQKAALQGHTGARIMLGSMLAAGRGATKDPVAAYQWIAAAALQGDTRGNATIVALERQLTPAQLTQAKIQAQSLAEGSKHSHELALVRRR